MSKKTKLFNTVIKSVDEKNRTVKFCFSDDQEDRHGEIVDQKSWKIKNFLKNPLILWGHQSWDPENVLGTAESLELDVDGKSYVTARFDDAETNPRADMVFRQLIKGTLRCVSAGFINHDYDYDEATNRSVLKENELLEISVVPIPANPRAIALSLADGSINRKDAEYLLRSMKAEVAELETEIARSPKQNKENKSMTEEQVQLLQTAVDGIAKLNGAIEDLKVKQEELSTDVSALKEAAPKEDPKEEPKDDDPQADGKDEPKPADQDDEDDKQEPAKPGDVDQGGAGDGDDFDPDAELTPELQAEIDAAIEAAEDAA